MSLADWYDLHSRFLALGGDVQNLVPKFGARGRGLFAVESDRPAGVFCPKQLFLNTQHLSFTQAGGIGIAESAGYSPGVTSFFDDYYNDWSWHGGGRNEALSFLEGLRSLPIQIRARLIELNILPPSLLNPPLDEASIFRRFIFTRTASYDGSQILAPVWDLVNHSAFVLPFRNTSIGLHTPPRGDDPELLQKYSDLKSPLGMWAHYGFSCPCTVVFSCPVVLASVHSPFIVQCLGQHYSKGFSLYGSVTSDGELLTIPCMPIGSVSSTLPLATLVAMLSPFGISDLAIRDFYRQLTEFNVEIRSGLFEQTSSIETPLVIALREGLNLEWRLIARSIVL